MSSANLHIVCPHCNQTLSAPVSYCPYCGIDLGLAASFTESSLQAPGEALAAAPVAPEILVPRMGEYLVENGMLTAQQLAHALERQRQMAEQGSPVLLGQALRDLGYVDAQTLDQVVTVQILQLQQALQAKNNQLEQRVQERTAELRRALARLTDLNQFRSNFIANISHELRTPLTLLKGYVHMLEAGEFGDLSQDQATILARVVQAEARLEKLIEDLIQFTVAQRGELSLNLSVLDVGEAIQAIVKNRQTQAQAARIRLMAKAPLEQALVFCDRQKITWVIAELVSNALKFTPQGGEVTVEARPAEGFVTVAVSDTGIGIPADRMGEIFEPFHQLDGSTTRRYGGTGLGLALCQRILEAHGSQIRVFSREGKGSRFEFQLPLADQPLSQESGK
ncbi:MAG: ATP-binding protein [Anaerolineales bacterium]|nr:ATP-binding protein [Anaerolineales bacterium]